MNAIIENAVERIRYIRAARHERVFAMECEVNILQSNIDDIAKDFDDEISRYELVIKDEVMRLESSYKLDGCKITYRRGYKSYSWLKDKLEGYFEAIGEDIGKFRTEKDVSPTVILKIDE